MDKQKSAYSGRFADEQQPRSSAAPRRKAAGTEAPRKPSGFSTAGQAPRHKSAPAAEEAAPVKKAKKLRFKREKKEKPLREPGKRKPWLIRALVALLIAVLVGLILLIAFGDRGTYHQMPIITREEVKPSFEPEKTPLPGVEEAI